MPEKIEGPYPCDGAVAMIVPGVDASRDIFRANPIRIKAMSGPRTEQWSWDRGLLDLSTADPGAADAP